MFTAAFRRQFATVACTILMSSACIVSAIGPAANGASAIATRTVA